MHPLTCYAGQISLCHAKIEKISEKIFVMIDKYGGGDNFWILWGGDIELMGGQSPPLRKTLALEKFDCTYWTLPSMTFDLLCIFRLMFDEMRLSLTCTSVSICTRNQNQCQAKLCPTNALLF